MNKLIALAILSLLGIGIPVAYTAGPFTPKVEVGNCSSGDFVTGYSATGTRTCGTPAGGTPANPSATAGPTAVNGSASTYMRSDAAPAVQQGSASQKGIVQVDGTSITAASGVISATGSSGANPSATASDTAVNGSATTFMRSDAAPAVQKATAGQFGVVEVDGSTITATAGVISATSTSSTGANPSATAGPTAVNGSAATFMRSDGAPAVQQGSAAQKGIVQVDGTSITASSGVISATGVSGANPTATAKDTAVNGSATTYMRSDGAPAIQKATSGQFGLVEVDGTTITASGGVITAAAGTGVLGANPSATAGPTAVNGSATTYLRSDGAPAVQLGTAAQKGLVQCDGTTITCTAGVITATATGTGDVVGPGSATDSNVVLFDGTTGKLIKNSSIVGANVLVSGGALGTPLSGTATNLTGLPLASGVTGILPGANGGTGNSFTEFTGPLSSTKTFTLPNASATILTSNAAVTVAQGGTGITSGTSGGVPYFSGSTTIASSGALTANLPVIGGGAGAAPGVGTRSGNTTAYVTTTGTQTSGRCVEIDANGNHIASAAGCAIVKSNESIGWVATTNPDQTVVLTASSAMTVTAARGTVATAVGATATIQPYKTASGTACSGGTALTTGTFDANGTANTNQTLTLAGSGAPSMSVGDRICLSTANGTAFAAGTGNGGITFEYTVP